MTEGNENGYSFWADQASCHSDGTEEDKKGIPAPSVPDPVFGPYAKSKEDSNLSSEDIPIFENMEQPGIHEKEDAFPEFPSKGQDMPKNRKKNKKKHSFFRKGLSLFAKASIFGIVAGASFIGFNSLYYHLNPSARPSANIDGRDGAMKNGQNNGSISADFTISSTIVAQGTSITTADVSDIVEQAMPSLVSISCTFRTSSSFFGYLYEGTASGSGSGIIVGQNDTELLIATNNHVIDDALTTTITFLDGTEAPATVKGTDSDTDLAIVSVALDDLGSTTLESIQIVTLGNSDDVEVGQMVVAIGNALGYGQTTTVGYISAKEREITVKDSNTGKSTSMIALQVDAAINPGNSGGALLNTKGEVIGINSAKLSGTAVEGMGYAIPISNVSDILAELMSREVLTEEERGYLGVEMSRTEITEEISQAYGWPIGVYITNVLENGAGAKYGILAGDIITRVNSSKISTNTQLQEKISSYRAGTTVTITLWRMENGSYAEHTLDVVLGSRADFE